MIVVLLCIDGGIIPTRNGLDYTRFHSVNTLVLRWSEACLMEHKPDTESEKTYNDKIKVPQYYLNIAAKCFGVENHSSSSTFMDTTYILNRVFRVKNPTVN